MSEVDGEAARPPLLGDDDKVAVTGPAAAAGKVDAAVGLLGVDATGCISDYRLGVRRQC